jgi:nicotinate-nucleotide adenylyltransferase
MKIGLYFGTFNPIHVGHLIIANHMAENSDLDQVWLVVTPHNPFKKKKPCSMTTIACKWHLSTEDFPKLKPSDIEFKLSQPNYTVNTLVHLREIPQS